MQITAPAYHARITDYDGTTSVRTYTAPEADTLIVTALWDEDQVEVDADRSGRLTLTRTITGHRSALDTERRTLHRTTRLEPVRRPRTLTGRQYEDLALILARDDQGGARLIDGRIRVGLVSVPPAAAARLLANGWLTAERNHTVTVSCAGRIAMALHEHQTETGVMGTDKWIVNAFGVGDWALGPSLYLVRCSCGHHDEHRYDDRSMAQRAARRHRLAHLRAALDLTA
ncbi:hypothetical protein ACVW0K_007323 [Streptomyces filamentosus]